MIKSEREKSQVLSWPKVVLYLFYCIINLFLLTVLYSDVFFFRAFGLELTYIHYLFFFFDWFINIDFNFNIITSHSIWVYCKELCSLSSSQILPIHLPQSRSFLFGFGGLGFGGGRTEDGLLSFSLSRFPTPNSSLNSSTSKVLVSFPCFGLNLLLYFHTHTHTQPKKKKN